MAKEFSVIPVIVIFRPRLPYVGLVSISPTILSSNPIKGTGNIDSGENAITPKIIPNIAVTLNDFLYASGADVFSIVTSFLLLM